MKTRMTPHGCPNERRGFVSMPLMFVFLGMLLLFSFLINVGLVVSRKIETQNAADSVAYSTALQRARGMNAITAANHLMGELHAIVVLHHAMGGDEMDGLKDKRTTDQFVAKMLPLSQMLADKLSRIPAPKKIMEEVKKDPLYGGAIGASKERLQQLLVSAYLTHALGGFLEKSVSWIPYVGKVLMAYGLTVQGIALGFEGKIYQEWQTIFLFEKAASGTVSVKKQLQRTVIPALHTYTQAMTYYVPFIKTPQALKKAAEANKVEADMYPGPFIPPLMLPIEMESEKLWTGNPKFEELKSTALPKSQLTRASTPWIRHWRVPFLKFSEAALKLSRFKMFYVDHTNDWTLELVKRAKEKNKVHLYIMKETKLGEKDKGLEDWTKKEGSEKADELFCSLGFAIQKPPKYHRLSLFRNPTPDGIFCYAQAMLYNANKQKVNEATNGRQKYVGWDTLNWDDSGFAGEWFRDDTKEKFDVVDVAEPTILLNWRVKLVPATRMTKEASLVKGIFWEEGRPHFLKIIPGRSQTRTH